MRRYDRPLGEEGEYEPGSNETVLRNKLHIIDADEMAVAEAQRLLDVQLKYYEEVDLMELSLTAEFIRQMHKDWLGTLYDWAGRYRTVEMSKDSVSFAPAYRAAENMDMLERDYLARLTPCKPGALPIVARAMAEVHATLVFIHPFREGNGRLARWLAALMAVQAGYPAPLYRVSADEADNTREKYFAAMRQGYLARYDDLTRFFEEALAARLDEAKPD